MSIPHLHSNPVLNRELRTRWRGGRIYWLLMGFSALLAIGMVLIYSNYNYPSTIQMRSAGHSIFLGLSMVQLALWLLVAPLLTATSISAERERGMLDAIQLSRMNARDIVFGKFVSALSTVFLMTLAVLPISAICFLLGGISPIEFLLSALLNFVTACTGTAFGLACSSWSRRANTSIPLTYFAVALWLIATALLLLVTCVPYRGYSHTFFYSRFGFELLDVKNPNSFALALNTLGLSNPFASIGSLLDNGIAAILSKSALSATIAPVVTCLVLQAGLILILLQLATRGARKVFPEQPMQQRKKVLGLRYGEKGLVIGWQPAWDSSTFAAATYLTTNRDLDEETPAERPAQPDPVQPAWHSVPLLSFIRFANPVLHREFHSKFRLRFSAWTAVLGAAIFLPLVFFYLSYLFVILDSHYVASAVYSIWGSCILGGLSIGGFLMAVMSAKSFAREKETGSWDSLQLSLLPRSQIIAGKLLASVAFCSLLALPWLIMLAAGIRSVTPSYVIDNNPNYLANSNLDVIYSEPSIHLLYDKVSLLQAACALWILYGTLFLSGAVGLWVSWRCRRSIAAISWTFGALIAVWVFLPLMLVALLNNLWRISSPSSTWTYIFSGTLENKLGELGELVLKTVHPFMAALNLFGSTHFSVSSHNPLLIGLLCGLVQFGLATAILIHLHRSMHRHANHERQEPSRFTARFSAVKKPVLQN